MAASSFATATIAKEQMDVSDHASLREVFEYKNGKVWVSEMAVKGLFQGSALRIGMEVVSLNNVDCSLLTPAGIQALLEADEEDCITILARLPILTPGLLITEVLRKETKESKLGLTFRMLNRKIFLTNIANGSLSSTSKLMVGMELFMINNIPCQSAEKVAQLLGESTGIITFVAGASSKTISPGRRLLKTATVEKENPSLKLGIAVSRYGEMIVIDKIHEGSLASETDLRKGMELLSINNVSCKHKTILDVEELLSMETDTVTILAEWTTGPQGDLVTGTFVKDRTNAKAGITMRYQNGKVLIKHIQEGALAATTDLDVGMWIKAVNNRDCTGLSVQKVAKILGAEDHVVTILAETTTETFEEPKEEEDSEEAEGEGDADDAEKPAEKEEGDETPNDAAAADGDQDGMVEEAIADATKPAADVC